MEIQNEPHTSYQSTVPPRTWLIENILITLFCCNILGVIGIWYSAQVEAKFYKGDIDGAHQDSNTAKILALVTLILGAMGIIGVMLMYGALIFTAIAGGV
ncbi:MAG: CD225/dispanin family protein [Chryseobacterium sp.]|nr:CD225/dispanin family protein [Chryseobacterium sp.]